MLQSSGCRRYDFLLVIPAQAEPMSFHSQITEVPCGTFIGMVPRLRRDDGLMERSFE